MLPVVRTARMQRELVQILADLEDYSPRAAERLATAVDEKCALLSQLPSLGRARDEFKQGLRSVVIEKYILFYRVHGDHIEALHLLDGRRDLESILQNDPTD